MPDPNQVERVPSFRELYTRLLSEFGPQDWWPADSPFEMMVGAVLTQNTAWRNVEASICNLRGAGLLTPTALTHCGVSTIHELIRPSGFMTAKAATLVRLSGWVLDHPDAEIAEWNDEALRVSLLDIKGVGPETADAIAMYAYDQALFIWDAYARRFSGQVWNAVIPEYEIARRRYDEQFRAARFTISEAQELHALIVDAGKRMRAG